MLGLSVVLITFALGLMSGVPLGIYVICRAGARAIDYDDGSRPGKKWG